MRYKAICKMFKANATALTESQLQAGLDRLNGVREKVEHVLVESKRTDGLFHARIQLWHKGSHKLIARTGTVKDEALAKLGLAAPVKAWRLEI